MMSDTNIQILVA